MNLVLADVNRSRLKRLITESIDVGHRNAKQHDLVPRIGGLALGIKDLRATVKIALLQKRQRTAGIRSHRETEQGSIDDQRSF